MGILSPFSVPKGNVRARWFQMFSRIHQNRKYKNTRLLVYWYGSENPNISYSLIPRTNFIPYSVGLERGLTKLPKSIVDKIKTGNRSLTPNEMLLRAALKQLTKEIKKSPAERSHLLSEYVNDGDSSDDDSTSSSSSSNSSSSSSTTDEEEEAERRRQEEELLRQAEEKRRIKNEKRRKKDQERRQRERERKQQELERKRIQREKKREQEREKQEANKLKPVKKKETRGRKKKRP